MLPSKLEIRRPKTLIEALGIMPSDKDRVQFLAGGTDLIPRIKEGLYGSKILVDMSLLRPELGRIKLENDILRIGSLVTHTQICQSGLIRDILPVLSSACQTVGSRQIRNRGTIGGNIVNASPAGDTLPVLLALEARVKLISCSGRREVLLEDFIVGPGKTLLEAGEIVTEVCIPLKPKISKGVYKKLGIRNALNIAIASVAVVVDSGGCKRVAYGALAPRPIRAHSLEEKLNKNEPIIWDNLKSVIGETIQPISDIRASAEYRKEMATNLTYVCLTELGLISESSI